MASLDTVRRVLATEGAVLGIKADPDYTRRPEPEKRLAVLRPPACAITRKPRPIWR
jgi:hypothetical protein